MQFVAADDLISRLPKLLSRCNYLNACDASMIGSLGVFMATPDVASGA